MQSDIDKRALRRRIEQGVQNEKKARRLVLTVVNTVLFVAFTIIAWMMAASGAEGLPPAAGEMIAGALAMMTAGWFMAVLFQWIGLALETKLGERELRDKIAARELNRVMLGGALEDDEETPEKAKRAMRLTDDGELEALDDAQTDENEPPLKAQRGNSADR